MVASTDTYYNDYDKNLTSGSYRNIKAIYSYKRADSTTFIICDNDDYRISNFSTNKFLDSAPKAEEQISEDVIKNEEYRLKKFNKENKIIKSIDCIINFKALYSIHNNIKKLTRVFRRT